MYLISPFTYVLEYLLSLGFFYSLGVGRCTFIFIITESKFDVREVWGLLCSVRDAAPMNPGIENNFC